jgi:hypothetical protein
MYGAFGNDENKPKSGRPGGISLRGPNSGAGASTIRPDYRTQAMLAAQQAGQRYRQNQADLSMVQQNMGGFAAANPEGARIHAQGLAAAMQSNPASAQAPTTPGAGQPAAGAFNFGNTGAPGALPNQGGPENVLGNEIRPGIFQDPMDKSAYGDSPSSAVNFTRTGSMGIPRQGGVAAATGFGPFGRTPQEQTAIENRVGEIQRATNFIRSMRDIPSERDKLKSQAGQYVSLNQGLGSFLNQGSQRNYARDRLKDLEANDLSKSKLAQEGAQNAFDNEIARQKLAQGAFSTDTITLPDGREVPMITNNREGTITYGQPPTIQLSPEQAQDQFTREADKMESDSRFMESERDIFSGMTRDEWIKSKVAEASGQGGTAAQAGTPGQQVGKSGNPKEQWFKGSDGKAKRYVVENGKWVQRDA